MQIENAFFVKKTVLGLGLFSAGQSPCISMPRVALHDFARCIQLGIILVLF